MTRDWARIKADYVEGLRDDNGVLFEPTLDFLSQKYGVPMSTLMKRSAKENWTAQRKMYGRKVEEARQTEKSAVLASEAAQIDSEFLELARTGARMVRAVMATRGVVTKDGQRSIGLSPGELAALAKAGRDYQAMANLALGEVTDRTKLEVEVDEGGGVSGLLKAVMADAANKR